MTMLGMETGHVELGLAPAADSLSGTVSTDILSMKNHGRVRFIILKGAGGTGTSVITVEACDDVSASNSSAVAFRYRNTVAGSDPGDITVATSSGFTTSTQANEIYEVEVDAEKLLSDGYEFVRLKATEDTDNPELAGIIALMELPRFATSPSSATS